MFFWQLPPFLLFGIYWTFVHPLFRRKNNKEYEDMEDEAITRVKRRIDVKWGLYCLLSLLVWCCLIIGIVVLLMKTDGDKTGLTRRWVKTGLWETWRERVYY